MISPRKHRRFGILLVCFAGLLTAVGMEMAATRVFVQELRQERPKVVKPADIREPFNPLSKERKQRNLLEPTDGRLMFGLGGNEIKAIDNVGAGNDATDITSNSDREPVFSPDGTKILYRSGRDSDWGGK